MNHQFPLSKTLFHPGLWAGLLLLLLSGAIPNRVAAQTTLAVGDIAFLELSGEIPLTVSRLFYLRI